MHCAACHTFFPAPKDEAPRSNVLIHHIGLVQGHVCTLCRCGLEGESCKVGFVALGAARAPTLGESAHPDNVEWSTALRVIQRMSPAQDVYCDEMCASPRVRRPCLNSFNGTSAVMSDTAASWWHVVEICLGNHATRFGPCRATLDMVGHHARPGRAWRCMSYRPPGLRRWGVMQQRVNLSNRSCLGACLQNNLVRP